MDQNFHHCGLEPNDTIVDYDNKAEVWACELDGLAEYVSEARGPPLVTPLTCLRAPAWQQRQTTSASALQSTRTIFSPWESMVYGWMQPSVRRTSPHEAFYADAIPHRYGPK
jgi:hypothetical protein